MTAIKGTNIAAPVVPFSTDDVHHTHEAIFGRGGYRCCDSQAERDAIPQPRREAGMLVFTIEDSKTWRLLPDLLTWVQFSAVSSLAGLADVSLDGLSNGNVLRYSGGDSRWKNYPEEQLTDGGNF